MPNWTDLGSDVPSRRDVEDMEREEAERTRRNNDTEARTSRYLRDHPSASFAEADFYTRRKR